MSIKKRVRAMLSTTIAGTAALFLAAGGGLPATASPSTDPLINPDGRGTVTIHAIEQDADVGSPADGRHHAELADRPGIPGLTFTAQLIDSVEADGRSYSLDLGTNIGWANATQLKLDVKTGKWNFEGKPAEIVLNGNVHSAATGSADGPYSPAVMKDLPIGLYFFEETEAPADVTRTLPWAMTVPLTHPTERDAWMYDIHVYPKNTTTVINKTVDDLEAAVPGDIVTWTITAGFPLIANPHPAPPQPLSATAPVMSWDEKFLPPERYVIKDDFDPRLVPLKTGAFNVEILGGDGLILDSNDYRVWWDDAEGGKSLFFSLTELGRAKVATVVSWSDSPTEVKVQLTIKTEVHTLTEGPMRGTIGDGIITNQARLYLDQDTIDKDIPIKSEEPVTKWGDILIKKVDADYSDYLLQGAEFSIYGSKTDAENGTNPLEVNGKRTFTTDWNGTVRISGLRYSDWTMNEQVKRGEAGWKSYWIVETKAPYGYELLAEPIEVEVDSAQQSVEFATVIKNAPHNTRFELPLTGAGGTWLFTAGGLLLAGGGLAIALRKKKPKETIEL